MRRRPTNLIAAIRSGNPLNEAPRIAASPMCAIIRRMRGSTCAAQAQYQHRRDASASG
jgi:hypothetical protein